MGLGVLVSFSPLRVAHAVNPETLLMPGKLTAAHAKYEEDCTQCHDRSDRSRQTSLCLACHEDVAADVTARRGFHGRLPGGDGAQCRACHTEHLGRDADIVKLSREQFDHAQTDFALDGAHRAIACGGCHRPAKKFREAPPDCHGCHRKIEPHEGKLGKDCGACHDAQSWAHIRFDHGKTKFALRDKHLEVPCAQCHFGNRYQGTPGQCASCHTPDDVHRGERGPACGDCHTTAGWKTARFDHEKKTGFALLGVHARVTCQDCHRSGSFEDDLPRECAGCHRGVDSHAGRLGEKCETCHDNERWKPSTFDHTRDTRWPLEGRHQKVDCHACHTAVVAKQKLPLECAGCHRASDAHAGKLGTDCAQCHTPEGWRTSVRFDHDLTDFPLVGLHVSVPCAQCHVTPAYKDVGAECIDCHRADDVHAGALGAKCADCHSPNGWRIWEFDHQAKTGFALAGAHARLACAGCHKQPADQVKLDPGCVSCHTQDDVHLGQYGRQCQRCHGTVTFKGARLQ